MRRRLYEFGAVPFTLVLGVLLIGMPAAVLLNLLLVSLRGVDFVSTANAVDLTLMNVILAPTFGSLVGRSIWLWNAGKLSHDMIRPPVALDPVAESPDADAGLAEQERIAALRAKIADHAAHDPARLKARVLMMAALGYAYVIALFGLVVGGIVLLITLDTPRWLRQYGVTALGFFALLLLMALWVRIEPPGGVRVTQAGSPTLFRMLTELCDALHALMPHDVLLTTELNAAVTELPRFGIFGAPRRYLLMGMPLLEALPLAQYRAVLAHELAHLARQDAQGTLWILRLTVTWRHVVVGLQAGRHWARWAVLPFFQWFAPRLELYAQLMSRIDEHEADALAASATDPATTARALVRLEIAHKLMTDEILPGIHRQSVERRDPPPDAVQRIGAVLRRPPDLGQAESWIRAALAEETVDRDSHPSLFRRIEQLTGRLDRDAIIATTIDEMAADTGERAADVLFGQARLGKLRQRLSESWQLETIDSWNRWHASARLWGAQATLKVHDVPLDVAWARASWALSCESPAVAITHLDNYLKRDPDHLEALVGLGKLLLDRPEISDHERGVLLLERARLRESEIALEACAALEAWYARHGRNDDVHRVQARSRQLERHVVSSLAERLHISADDILTPYQLSDNSVAVVRRVCAEEPRVKRAMVVRKQVQHLEDQPCVALVIEPEVPWYKPASQNVATEIATLVHERLTRTNVLDLLVLGAEPGSQLVRRLLTIPGAELYRKPRAD